MLLRPEERPRGEKILWAYNRLKLEIAYNLLIMKHSQGHGEKKQAKLFQFTEIECTFGKCLFD